MIKKFGNWLIEAFKETLNLSWTLVGLFIATLRICSNKYIDMMTDEIKTGREKK